HCCGAADLLRLQTGPRSCHGCPREARASRSRLLRRPARLGAAAYAQGSDIFIGPNQQVHLPHELWHVVQQKSGALAGVATQLGDDLVVENALLEKEVDIIGTLITHLIGKLNEHIIYHPTG
ncbi:MAG: DUF4157 domain-containing protein, partial [Psychrosphaera sp.]|nr:DUF4157 domain-containing protein [Psychrosphaera sp.]